MLADRLGELAALATAACWVFSALFFASAGARVGSLPVNVIRLPLAFPFLMAISYFTRGRLLPTDVSPDAFGWLALSGIIGVTLGDLALFRALVELGPRLTTLMMSLAPPLAALGGWLWLDERLEGRDLTGMTLTLVGVGWAVIGQPVRAPASASALTESAPARRSRGVFFAFLGAAGQGLGLLVSKRGIGAYDPFAATQIRLLAGLAGFVLVMVGAELMGRRTFAPALAALRDRAAMRDTALGAFFGPAVGIGLSLLAVQHTETGVAAALMATTPILILPFAVFWKKERVGSAGVLGAFVAVAGVIVLVS